MKVKDPQGKTWRVRRRWLPWRRRVRNWVPDLPLGGIGEDPISAIIGLAVLVLLLPSLVLALVVAIELLVLWLLLPLFLLVRVLFGHHWVVEVRRGWKPWWEEPSGDWAQSRRRIASIAELLSRGQPPPRTIGDG